MAGELKGLIEVGNTKNDNLEWFTPPSDGSSNIDVEFGNAYTTPIITRNGILIYTSMVYTGEDSDKTTGIYSYNYKTKESKKEVILGDKNSFVCFDGADNTKICLSYDGFFGSYNIDKNEFIIVSYNIAGTTIGNSSIKIFDADTFVEKSSIVFDNEGISGTRFTHLITFFITSNEYIAKTETDLNDVYRIFLYNQNADSSILIDYPLDPTDDTQGAPDMFGTALGLHELNGKEYLVSNIVHSPDGVNLYNEFYVYCITDNTRYFIGTGEILFSAVNGIPAMMYEYDNKIFQLPSAGLLVEILYFEKQNIESGVAQGNIITAVTINAEELKGKLVAEYPDYFSEGITVANNVFVAAKENFLIYGAYVSNDPDADISSAEYFIQFVYVYDINSNEIVAVSKPSIDLYPIDVSITPGNKIVLDNNLFQTTGQYYDLEYDAEGNVISYSLKQISVIYELDFGKIDIDDYCLKPVLREKFHVDNFGSLENI